MVKKLTWKQARERTGKTQADMARHLNISRQLYGLKENYKRTMRIDEGIEIARLAGIDINMIRTH